MNTDNRIQVNPGYRIRACAGLDPVSGTGPDPWFGMPFDRLMVLSNAEGPTAPSNVEGFTTLSKTEGESSYRLKFQEPLDTGSLPAMRVLAGMTDCDTVSEARKHI